MQGTHHIGGKGATRGRGRCRGGVATINQLSNLADELVRSILRGSAAATVVMVVVVMCAAGLLRGCGVAPFAGVADEVLAGDVVGDEVVPEVGWLSIDCSWVENC